MASDSVRKVVVMTIAMCIGGYILGPPLYRHFKEAIAAATSSSSSACPACDCDCSSLPVLTIPPGINYRAK